MKCLEGHVKLHLSVVLAPVAVDELGRIQRVFHRFLVQTHKAPTPLFRFVVQQIHNKSKQIEFELKRQLVDF